VIALVLYTRHQKALLHQVGDVFSSKMLDQENKKASIKQKYCYMEYFETGGGRVYIYKKSERKKMRATRFGALHHIYPYCFYFLIVYYLHLASVIHAQKIVQAGITFSTDFSSTPSWTHAGACLLEMHFHKKSNKCNSKKQESDFVQVAQLDELWDASPL
ncbi:hypothetical protein ACJX0J_021844, partial [Zea mays]